MRTSLLLVAFGLFTLSASAQKFFGKAVYHSAMSLDIELDSNTVNQGQQAQVQKMLREAMQNDHELLFDRHTSLYKEVENLEKDGHMGMKLLGSFTGSGGQLYKDSKSLESLRQTEFFGKLFLIEDTLEKLDWQLVNESKQIGTYTCYKATALRKTLERSFSTGEEGEEMADDTVEVTITAWYTPQIPVSTGPDSYFGLPGLILEVNDGSMQMLCTKLVLNPKEEVKIKKPEQGERVTHAEYRKIMDEKLRQMQQMYGGERRGSGKGSVKIKMR